MIDEKKLAELRVGVPRESKMGDSFGVPLTEIQFNDLADTIEALWEENAELKDTYQMMNEKFCSRLEKLEAVARAAERLEPMKKLWKTETVDVGQPKINNDVLDNWNSLFKALAALKERCGHDVDGGDCFTCYPSKELGK